MHLINHRCLLCCVSYVLVFNFTAVILFIELHNLIYNAYVYVNCFLYTYLSYSAFLQTPTMRLQLEYIAQCTPMVGCICFEGYFVYRFFFFFLCPLCLCLTFLQYCVPFYIGCRGYNAVEDDGMQPCWGCFVYIHYYYVV